ncbi:hypothetical protein PFISCL1PPCAC_8215, partial [Pristionchus fissidentatus]
NSLFIGVFITTTNGHSKGGSQSVVHLWRLHPHSIDLSLLVVGVVSGVLSVGGSIGLLGPVVDEVGGDGLGHVVVPLLPHVRLEHLDDGLVEESLECLLLVGGECESVLSVHLTEVSEVLTETDGRDTHDLT